MPTFLIVAGSAVFEVILLSLAVLAVLRAWKLGSIFERWRSYWQARGGLLGELLSCPLCLSYHVSFWLEVIFLLPIKVYEHAYQGIALAPVIIFAAAALAQTVWFAQHRNVE